MILFKSKCRKREYLSGGDLFVDEKGESFVACGFKVFLKKLFVRENAGIVALDVKKWVFSFSRWRAS